MSQQQYFYYPQHEVQLAKMETENLILDKDGIIILVLDLLFLRQKSIEKTYAIFCLYSALSPKGCSCHCALIPIGMEF